MQDEIIAPEVPVEAPVETPTPVEVEHLEDAPVKETEAELETLESGKRPDEVVIDGQVIPDPTKDHVTSLNQ